MIEIDNEGFVSVQSNTIPLRNYLFYLTYNNRSVSSSNMDIDLSSSDIYKSSNLYSQKSNKEFSQRYNMDKGEIVMSFSPELCATVAKHRFRDNMSDFKKNFIENITGILTEHLEQKEYTIFVHEYDSKQMRVHAHVLFYPYVDTKESVKVKMEKVVVRAPKVWIEPDRLAKIKTDFNQYAKVLYNGLEGKTAVVPSDKIADTDLMSLISLTKQEPPIYDKDQAKTVLPASTMASINKKLLLLSETTSDNNINTKLDWSQIVDYLYDFDDHEAKGLFFNHPAIDKIIKSFSLNKSNPKFSLVFLKIIRMTSDKKILNIIINKIKSNKGQEVKNIIMEEFSRGFEDRINFKTKNQTQNMI